MAREKLTREKHENFVTTKINACHPVGIPNDCQMLLTVTCSIDKCTACSLLRPKVDLMLASVYKAKTFLTYIALAGIHSPPTSLLVLYLSQCAYFVLNSQDWEACTAQGFGLNSMLDSMWSSGTTLSMGPISARYDHVDSIHTMYISE